LPVPLLVVASFLAGVGLLIFNTLYETMLQRHIPADRLGRVTSYDWFGSLAAAPLGYALAAPLANLVGVSTALWIVGLGALTVLGSIIANPSVRALRAFPDGRDPAESDSHGTLPAGSVREP
jgi:MFS family permease